MPLSIASLFSTMPALLSTPVRPCPRTSLSLPPVCQPTSSGLQHHISRSAATPTPDGYRLVYPALESDSRLVYDEKQASTAIWFFVCYGEHFVFWTVALFGARVDGVDCRGGVSGEPRDGASVRCWPESTSHFQAPWLFDHS